MEECSQRAGSDDMKIKCCCALASTFQKQRIDNGFARNVPESLRSYPFVAKKVGIVVEDRSRCQNGPLCQKLIISKKCKPLSIT